MEISMHLTQRKLAGAIAGAALFLAAAGPCAASSEESVDQMTKQALTLDAHPRQGAAQFKKYCAQCHGRQAHGDPARLIPSLAGQRFSYLVRQLANFSGEQRDSATMHQVVSQKALQSPQSWVDIAAFLNNVPVPAVVQTGDGAHLALGRGIFHEQCTSCHREDARGDDDGFVPALRAQHFPYLVSQMRKLADGHRHNVDENLVRFLRSFETEDIDAVADYLSRLRGPGKDRKSMRNDGVVVD
jgi:cytochrome c553